MSLEAQARQTAINIEQPGETIKTADSSINTIPFWDSTAETLNPKQRFVAELNYNVTVLQAFYNDAQSLLPGLRRKASGTTYTDNEKDNDLIGAHIQGLVDYYLADQSSDSNYITGRSTDEGYYYNGRLDFYSDWLKEEKNRIYFDISQAEATDITIQAREVEKKEKSIISKVPQGKRILGELLDESLQRESTRGLFEEFYVEIIYNTALFQAFHEDAKTQFSRLSNKFYGKNSDITKEEEQNLISQYVIGLMDVYRRHKLQKETGIDWRENDETSYYLSRLDPILKKVETQREEIEQYASLWKLSKLRKEEKKVERKAHSYLSSLDSTEELFELLYEGLPDEDIIEVLNRKGLEFRSTVGTTALNLANNYGLEATALSGGSLLVYLQHELLPNLTDADPLLFYAMLAGSYSLWIKAMLKSSKENYELLKDGGYSINLFSKLFLHASQGMTDNEKLQEISSRVGYILWELSKEAVYWRGQVWLTGHLDNNTYLFITASNLVATVWEHSMAHVIKQARVNVIPKVQNLTKEGKTLPEILEILKEEGLIHERALATEITLTRKTIIPEIKRLRKEGKKRSEISQILFASGLMHVLSSHSDEQIKFIEIHIDTGEEENGWGKDVSDVA